MANLRKKFSAAEKAKIALEAMKGNVTQNEITKKYGVHSTQIHTWKKQLKEHITEIFQGKRGKINKDKDDLISELYQQIGQLKVENDFLKKKSELFD